MGMFRPLAFFALLSFQTLAQSLTITTGVAAPYSSPALYQQGYVNHVIKEAMALQGFEVSFVYFPWARAYEEALSGLYDATSYWYASDRRELDFFYSNPLVTERVVFFQRKTNGPSQWNSLADLGHLRLGLTRGYTYTPKLWQLAEAEPDRVSIVNSDEQNMRMLALGRIDIFPIDEAIGWHLANASLAAEQMKRLKTLNKPLAVRAGHLLFPKHKPGSRALLNALNEGLAELRASGRLARMKEGLITGRYSQFIEAKTSPQ